MILLPEVFTYLEADFIDNADLTIVCIKSGDIFKEWRQTAHSGRNRWETDSKLYDKYHGFPTRTILIR